MTPFPWPDLFIIAALILVNGIFAMSELAIVSAKTTTLKSKAEKGSRGAKAALELAVLRQVAPWLELLAGGRVNLIGGSLRGPNNTLYETDVSWFDPFIGARLTTHAGERWTFTLRGDIGGFGIGSDFAWQLHPEAEFALSPTVSLTGGYRLLGMDYEEGSGLDRFAYDVRTFGVQLGVALHF